MHLKTLCCQDLLEVENQSSFGELAMHDEIKISLQTFVWVISDIANRSSNSQTNRYIW